MDRSVIRAALCIAALGMVGCAATLDDAQTTEVKRDLAASPEAVYGALTRSMRSCYFRPSIRLEADYLPTAQAGSIRLSWANDAGLIEWLRVQVSPGAAGGTTLKALHRTAQREFGPALEAWLRGELQPCPYA